MQPASLCIGTNEPAFRLALAIGLVAAVTSLAPLVKLEARLRGKTFVSLRRSLAWAAAEAAAFVGPMLLTIVLYALQHRTVSCASLVWRWYFLPPAVLIVTGVSWGVLNAVFQSRHARHS